MEINQQSDMLDQVVLTYLNNMEKCLDILEPSNLKKEWLKYSPHKASPLEQASSTVFNNSTTASMTDLVRIGFLSGQKVFGDSKMNEQWDIIVPECMAPKLTQILGNIPNVRKTSTIGNRFRNLLESWFSKTKPVLRDMETYEFNDEYMSCKVFLVSDSDCSELYFTTLLLRDYKTIQRSQGFIITKESPDIREALKNNMCNLKFCRHDEKVKKFEKLFFIARNNVFHLKNESMRFLGCIEFLDANQVSTVSAN